MSIMEFLLVLNPTYWVRHIFEEAWGAYDILGVWKYPLVIIGIVGYVYLSTKSAALTALLIIVAFAVFGTSVFTTGTAVLNSFLGMITIMGIAGLLLAFLMKKEVSEVASGD